MDESQLVSNSSSFINGHDHRLGEVTVYQDLPASSEYPRRHCWMEPDRQSAPYLCRVLATTPKVTSAEPCFDLMPCLQEGHGGTAL